MTTVSPSQPALHLDCTRTYIGKLEAEGVIQRQGDGSRLITAALPTIASHRTFVTIASAPHPP